MNGLVYNSLSSWPLGAVETARNNSRGLAAHSHIMDLHQHDRCKWEGCGSYEVVSGGIYCQEHMNQHLFPGKNQAVPGSSVNPQFDYPRNSTTVRLKTTVAENGSLNNLPSPGPTPPPNAKKQLSDKHTARKTVKQSTHLGQPNIASPFPVQRPPVDISSANPRPSKRQCLSGMPNISEPRLPSDNPPFSENGISHQSTRGMFRQPEETTYKLSAVDDFALRPKKKEAVNQSVRSKAYNDQRPLHRGETHQNSSGRQAQPSNKPPQNTNSNGSIHPRSFVTDLTNSNGLKPPSPRSPHPKPRLSPTNYSIAEHHQNPQVPSRGTPDSAAVLNDEEYWKGPPQTQPGTVSQAQHGHIVDQDPMNSRAQIPLEKIISSAPTVQPTSEPTHGASPELHTPRQTPNIRTLDDGPRSVRMGSAGAFKELETRQSPLDEKSSTPIGPVSSSPEAERITTMDSTKSTVYVPPAPDLPITPQLQATMAAPSQLNSETQPSMRTVEPVSIPSAGEHRPTTMNNEGHLSALLGGREWKKMSPEERRLFWVSQHDPVKFDAQIYSENNRPFRPGDDLFGVSDDALPPRSKRPAAHFDYIDPRIHYASRQSERGWYQRKQDEISARDNRKIHLGRAIKRTVQRKRATPKFEQWQKQDSLPRRVRENKKWLAAVDVLDQLAAQARGEKVMGKPRKKSSTLKGNVKPTTNTGTDSDADIESS